MIGEPEIECPYCGHPHVPNHDETDDGEWQCEECLKLFHVTVEYVPQYSVSKGDDHE